MRTNVVFPLAGAAALALLIFGRTGCEETSAKFVATTIKNERQFEQVKAQAAQLSLEHLKAFEDGEVMNLDAINDLKQTDKMFDELTRFAPNDFAVLFGAGQVAFVLENYAKAEPLLNQAAKLAPDVPDPAVIQLGAQASYYLSQAREFRDDLPGARTAIDQALNRDPQNPNYLAQLASVFVQQRHLTDAKKVLELSLRVDPEHSRSLTLQRLIRRSEAAKKK